MSAGKLSRRDFLRATLTGAGLLSLEALLDACGQVLPENPPPVSPATAVPSPMEATLPSTSTGSPTDTTVVESSPTPEPTSTPVVIPDMVVTRGGEPEEMVRRTIAALGGMDKFVSPGARVVVKPNICVASRSYEYAATTNPWVVAALVKMALE